MKKLLGVTAVSLVLMLSGCSGDDNAASDDETTSTTSESTTTTETTTESTEPTETEDSDNAASGPYCDALKDARDHLSDIDFTQLDDKTYERLTSEIANVADSAPADIQTEWQTLLGALQQMNALLRTAGITFDDLSKLSAGQVPPGVDAQQLQKIAPKLQGLLADGRLQKASKSITKDAKQSCGITLD